MKYQLKVDISYIVMIALLILATDVYSEKIKIKKYLSDAHKTTDWTSGGKKQQLDFRYGNAKATLRQTGDILIESVVKHKGLLCATYSTGIRFGKGKPGCIDVKWITEPKFLTSKIQCNSAALIHSAADVDITAPKRFKKITCGQFLLKCSGTCK